MKKIKKIVSVVWMMLCIICLAFSSKADEYAVGQIIDGSVLTNLEKASDSRELILQDDDSNEEIVPFGTYLSNGEVTINKQGSGLVYVSGAKYCYRVSDVIYVELYLEQLSNGGWHTVKTHSKTAYNDNYAYTGLGFAVSSGHYYRVKGYHYAKKGSKIESVTTCSNGIYID